MIKIQMAQDRLEFDSSKRFFDSSGRLHVEISNISKAAVNPYYGREIPDSDELGLNPDKIYHLLRDPEELKNGTNSFNNIPLLIRHIPVNSKEPQKESVVGTVGSNAVFSAPYLKNSLCVWDQEAIDLIESGEQRELSSAYRYQADMTPGTYEGVPYDGVMRSIEGNHVALVRKGRAGSDVVVADEDSIFKQKEKEQMILKEIVKTALAKTKYASDADIQAKILNRSEKALKGLKLAQDEDAEQVAQAVVEAVTEAAVEAAESVVQGEPATDESGIVDFLKGKISEDDLGQIQSMLSARPAGDSDHAEDEDKEDEQANDNDQGITKAAMDAAIAKATAETAKQVRQEVEALATAREEVAPIVGKVAMDSAESVYKYALDHMGVNIKGVHPSAYRSMVSLAKNAQTKPKQSYAQDSKLDDDMMSVLPNATKFLKGE